MCLLISDLENLCIMPIKNDFFLPQLQFIMYIQQLASYMLILWSILLIWSNAQQRNSHANIIFLANFSFLSFIYYWKYLNQFHVPRCIFLGLLSLFDYSSIIFWHFVCYKRGYIFVQRIWKAYLNSGSDRSKSLYQM